jgi:hypothetical protein
MLTSRYKDSPLGYNEGIIRYRVPDTYASEEPPFYTFARSSFTTSASTRVLALVVKVLLAKRETNQPIPIMLKHVQLRG